MGITLQILIGQTGMLGFKEDVAGNSSAGSAIPFDGGAISMIIGSAIYFYKKINKSE